MKNWITGSAITAGTFLASLLGGWDAGLRTLTVLMILDYVTGIMVAGVFRKSKKTASGGLESRAGWKGLLRKGMELAIVLVGEQIDRTMGTSYVRDAVCIAFTINETVSILENAGLMGIPVPSVLGGAIDLLASRPEKNGTDPPFPERNDVNPSFPETKNVNPSFPESNSIRLSSPDFGDPDAQTEQEGKEACHGDMG